MGMKGLSPTHPAHETLRHTAGAFICVKMIFDPDTDIGHVPSIFKSFRTTMMDIQSRSLEYAEKSIFDEGTYLMSSDISKMLYDAVNNHVDRRILANK